MDRMVEIYVKGREKSTMSSYQSSYKRLLGLFERDKASDRIVSSQPEGRV